MSDRDDLLLVTRSLFTGNANDPVLPGAVRVRSGRITEVIRDLRTLPTDSSNVVDMGDRPILPGFVDPHAHSEVLARTEAVTVDCRAPKCRRVSDVLDTLRQHLGRTRDGWLVGQANLFFDQKLEERRFPTRRELDSVSTEVPIALRCGGHLTVLNSKALEVAGITAETGGSHSSITGRPTVELDSDGSPSGVVKEMDRLLPLPALSDSELQGAIETTMQRRFTRHGVTTVGEIGESEAGIRAYDNLLASGAPIPRMYFYLWVPGFAELDQAVKFADEFIPQATELARVHGLKIFADGGYSAKSAAMSRPYRNLPHHCGDVALSETELVDALITGDKHGLQLAIHANGDRAQQAVCGAVASIRQQLTPGVPAPRIEHAGNFVPNYSRQTQEWVAAGITPVPQPVFIYNFGEFVPDYVGDYARSGQFPFKSLLADGWRLSGSSDVWIGSEIQQTNPFLSIASAVARRTFHGHQLESHESVTVEQAIQMHTLNGAYAMGIDNHVGSIEVGKFADLIVLDRDPRTVPPEEFTDIGIDAVYRAGVAIESSGVPQ